MAGPKQGSAQVPANDTALKNPDNEFSDPGSAASITRKTRKHLKQDPAGQQGSTRFGSQSRKRTPL
jgi:hypothetical protein